MLQAIRDGSKGVTAKIIVGLIILTFALFGIESIVALGGGESAPAEVNGEEISEYKVSQMIQLQKRRLQSQFGENFDPSMLSDSMLRNSAIESLISESVLKQSSANSGIYFSDQDIDKLITQSPEFQVAGKFDRDQYDLVLRNAGFTRSTHRELLRSNLTMQQTQSAWQVSSFSTKNEESRSALLDSQQRNLYYVEFKLDDAKKNVSISDEEKEKYYSENPNLYMTQETVVVDYVELKRADLLAGLEVEENELQDRYTSIQEESTSKREYRVAHILLLDNKDETRNQLMEVKGKLSSGEEFAALAEAHSQDDSSKFSGGDLGFAGADIYESEFSAAILSLEEGQVSDIVETRDGLHLIKLLATRQPDVATFESLRDSLVKEIKDEKSQTIYIEKLEILNDEAFSSSTLKGSAQTLGLKIQTSSAFSKQGGVGIAKDGKVSAAAFSESVLFDDSNSEVIELGEGRAVVMHLNQFNESKVKSFKVVSAQIEAQLRNEKGSLNLKEQLTKALSEAEAGSFKGSWVSVESALRTDKSADAKIIGKAFTMALKSDSKPGFELVELSGGDHALLRLDAIKRVKAEQVSENEAQKVGRSKSGNEFKAYYQYSTDQASIERN